MTSIEAFEQLCQMSCPGFHSLPGCGQDLDEAGKPTRAWKQGKWLWGFAFQGERLDEALARLERVAFSAGDPSILIVNDDATVRIHLRHEQPEEIWVFDTDDSTDPDFKWILSLLFHHPDRLLPEAWIGGRRYAPTS